MEGIRIFSPQTCKGDNNDYIVNVVYHELLDVPVRPQQQLHDDEDMEIGNILQPTDAAARADADDESSVDLPC